MHRRGSVRAGRPRPPGSLTSVEGRKPYIGGGGTRHDTDGDWLPLPSTAYTSASPCPRMNQLTAPGPGRIDGLAPLASVYLMVVPFGKPPKVVPVPESTTKMSTSGSTASVAVNLKKPSWLFARGMWPPGFGPGGHDATGGVVSSQRLVTLTEVLWPAIWVVTVMVSVPRLDGAIGTLYVKDTWPLGSVLQSGVGLQVPVAPAF